jgi:acyl carrier protein
MHDSLNQQVRSTLREHGRIATDIDLLEDDADLYKAGLSSQATVNLMLALEEVFDVEFPDSMLHRAVFETIRSITAAVTQLPYERDGVSMPAVAPAVVLPSASTLQPVST